MITPHSLDVARSTLQVPLKRLGDIEHFDNMFHGERFLLVDGEGLGGAHGVFDLLQLVSQRRFSKDICIV